MKKILFLVCLLCTSFVSAQNYAELRDMFNKALKLSTDQATLNESLNVFNKIIAVDPTFNDVLGTKMQVLDDLGRTKEVMKVINRMIELTSKLRLPFAYLTKGMYEVRYGDLEASKLSYYKALQLSIKAMTDNNNRANQIFYLIVRKVTSSTIISKEEIAKLMPKSMNGADKKKNVDEIYDCINGSSLETIYATFTLFRNNDNKFLPLRKAMYKKGFLLIK